MPSVSPFSYRPEGRNRPAADFFGRLPTQNAFYILVEANEFCALYERWAREKGLACAQYPSLGRNHTAMMEIPPTRVRLLPTVRFVPGIEDELQSYRDGWWLVNRLLREPTIDYPNDPQLQQAITKRLVGSDGYELLRLKQRIVDGVLNVQHLATHLELARGYLRVRNANRAVMHIERAKAALQKVQLSASDKKILEQSLERIEGRIFEFSGRTGTPIQAFRIAGNQIKPHGRSNTNGMSR